MFFWHGTCSFSCVLARKVWGSPQVENDGSGSRFEDRPLFLLKSSKLGCSTKVWPPSKQHDPVARNAPNPPQVFCDALPSSSVSLSGSMRRRLLGFAPWPMSERLAVEPNVRTKQLSSASPSCLNNSVFMTRFVFVLFAIHLARDLYEHLKQICLYASTHLCLSVSVYI